MPSRAKKNYYAVRIGRGGAAIYNDWPQCEKAVNGFPGAQYKGFVTIQEAGNWLEGWTKLSHSNTDQVRPPQAESGILYTPMHDTILGLADDELDFELDGMPDVYYPPAERLIPIEMPHTDAIAVDSLSDAEARASRIEEDILLFDSGPVLSAEQNRVLERVLDGESIFFTGSAGTGKSVLLRAIIAALKKQQKDVAVTASTGIAAVNINGTTLHSFAGVGLGKEPLWELARKLRQSRRSMERWCRTEVLIIDEISMVDGNFFDKLEGLAEDLRRDKRPFGGIQLVVSGDFCQLPPVPDLHDGIPQPVTFAFDARSWDKCIKASIILNRVFRQKEHSFIQLLESVRYGEIDENSARELGGLSRPLVFSDGIEPTELYPLRREVEEANSTRLSSLQGPSHTYKSLDSPGYDIRNQKLTTQQAERLLDRLIAVQSITLKIGAQVMLIKNLNLEGGLVNGSLGQVVAFKSIEQAAADRNGFTNTEGLRYFATDPSNGMVPPRNGQLHGQLDEKALDEVSRGTRVWPLVKFVNGREVLCVPEEFTVENVKGGVEARRSQVPLILAWAMSVHKSQGQTLERLRVDLARTFEKGQAYVALSRAKSIDGLQILNFNVSKVMAHPRVLEWHAWLARKVEEEEEQAIVQELSTEAAFRDFFEDNEIF